MMTSSTIAHRRILTLSPIPCTTRRGMPSVFKALFRSRSEKRDTVASQDDMDVEHDRSRGGVGEDEFEEELEFEVRSKSYGRA